MADNNTRAMSTSWYRIKLDAGKTTKRGLKDVFHPQARFTRVTRRGCIVPEVYIEGRRPRNLNLGVKKFSYTVISAELPEPFGTEDAVRKRMDDLADYAFRHS